MALTKSSKVLNAVNQAATIFCEGMGKCGISIRSVTGTVVLSFLGSVDGVQFNPISVGAAPAALSSSQGSLPGTAVQTTAAAGDFEVTVGNLKFIRVQMTTGSGPATVVLGASDDGTYQEVFLDDDHGTSLGVLYPSTTSSAGVNTMTIPAVASRTIKLTSLEVTMTGVGFGGNAQLRIWDNAVFNGSPLYSAYLTGPVGSVGTQQKINLPEDAEGKKYITGKPGNALVIQIVNLGNVAATMNARNSYE